MPVGLGAGVVSFRSLRCLFQSIDVPRELGGRRVECIPWPDVVVIGSFNFRVRLARAETRHISHRQNRMVGNYAIFLTYE